MKRTASFPGFVALAWVCATLAAGAQPAASPAEQAEKIVVTGVKLSPQIVDDFVDAYAAPTLLLGKIARWKNAVCPEVSGIEFGGATVIAQRITTIAAMVGAPVSANSNCQTNIEVNFTDEPQKLLDGVLAQRPYLLGYSKGEAQARRMATVAYPAQAWYATQWEDNNGVVRSDESLDQCGGISRSDRSSCTISGANFGLRTRGDNKKSEFFNVLIVIDTSKNGIVSINSLADYIAMVAIAQPKSFETCQAVPSIINLMLPNCNPATKTMALTDIDIAYLRGLYRAKPDGSFDQQKSQIAGEMVKTRATQ